MHICMDVYNTYVCMCVNVRICVHMYCVYIHMYMCVNVRICACIYTYVGMCVFSICFMLLEDPNA